jgi:hypothetical protein
MLNKSSALPSSSLAAGLPLAAGTELEASLASVESELGALGDALCNNDMAEVDHHATALHRALANAVHQFAKAARSGPIPNPLRQRLMRASGLVASQRESLARATAALDRAIDVLIPSENAASVYSSFGAAERSGRGGSLQA